MHRQSNHLESPSPETVSDILKLVGSGKFVVSADRAEAVDAIFRAIDAKVSATFYVSPETYNDVMERYWTPHRTDATGLAPIGEQESAKIKSELGVSVEGSSFAALTCQECQHSNGMFDFIKQGLAEHGRSFVEAILSEHELAVVRINPKAAVVCGNCGNPILKPGSAEAPDRYYMCPKYGCCR